MRSKRVILSLLPGHLDVVAYEGTRYLVAQRITLPPVSDVADWVMVVRHSANELRSVVAKLKVVGVSASVLYRSPTQSVDLAELPIRDGSQAEAAAKLGCLNSLPYSAATAVCQASVVGRDARGQTQQTHVLVAAEREDVAQTLAELTEAGGLKFESATPLDAAILAKTAKLALRDKGHNRGWLYVGQYSSYFVIGNERTLVFNRRIDLGLESLANSLTHPIRTNDGQNPIELSMNAARSMLRQYGIPQVEQIVHESPNLTGRQVMPLLQPVIQRFIVELRQSLRFGISQEHRQELKIQVTGPGSCLPGFTELVAQELDVVTTRDEGYDSYDDTQLGSEGSELADASRDLDLLKQINLLPHQLARQRRTGRLSRWLWTGAVVAAAMIAVDSFQLNAQLTEARREARAYESRADDLKTLEETGKRLGTALSTMVQLQKTIDEEIGLRANFRAYLHELSRITPETIRFTTAKFDRNQDGLNGVFTGYALPNGLDADDTDLNSYVHDVRASPLFHDVVLSHVQMESLQNIDGQRFQLDLRAVTLPREVNSTPAMKHEVRKPITTTSKQPPPVYHPPHQIRTKSAATTTDSTATNVDPKQHDHEPLEQTAEHEVLRAQGQVKVDTLNSELDIKRAKLEALHRTIMKNLKKLNHDRAQLSAQQTADNQSPPGDDSVAKHPQQIGQHHQNQDAKKAEIDLDQRHLESQVALFKRLKTQFIQQKQQLEQFRSMTDDQTREKDVNHATERQHAVADTAGDGEDQTPTRRIERDNIHRQVVDRPLKSSDGDTK